MRNFAFKKRGIVSLKTRNCVLKMMDFAGGYNHPAAEEPDFGLHARRRQVDIPSSLEPVAVLDRNIDPCAVLR